MPKGRTARSELVITSHDVARMASVSQATVSRALRGDPRVAEATRRKVEKAAAALNYVPSRIGRAMATQSTRQVAIAADLDNTLYPLLMGPLYDRFAEHGYAVVLVATRSEDPSDYARVLDGTVEGVVLTTALLGSRIPEVLAQRRIPFVELNRSSGRPDVDAVFADNEAGARALGALLIGNGFREIGAILGPESTSTSRDREVGLRSALADAGIALPSQRVVRGAYSYVDGARMLGELLDRGERPEAVFCASDVLAVGAVTAARRRALRIPEDLAILGFDDLPVASWPGFEITTQHVDLHEMARSAADLMVQRLHGDTSAPVRRIFDTRTVIRASCPAGPAA